MPPWRAGSSALWPPVGRRRRSRRSRRLGERRGGRGDRRTPVSPRGNQGRTAGAAWFAYVVNVLVHEMGHLAAVRLLGLAPQRVVVLPFDFRRTADGWRVRIGQEWFVLSGGLVAWQAKGQPSPLHMIVFAGAGPAASLLLLLLYLALNPYGWSMLLAYQPGPILILVGIFAALVTVVGNLIPVRVDPMSGHASDGFVIRQGLARLRKAAASAA